MSLTNFFILLIVQLGINNYPTHEFYVSTTSVDFVLDKNEIQITSQFFVEDIENLKKFQAPNKILIFEKKNSKDINLFLELLESIPNEKGVIFIGDGDQLSPIM